MVERDIEVNERGGTVDGRERGERIIREVDSFEVRERRETGREISNVVPREVLRSGERERERGREGGRQGVREREVRRGKGRRERV